MAQRHIPTVEGRFGGLAAAEPLKHASVQIILIDPGKPPSVSTAA
jgi:hypothetical protein